MQESYPILMSSYALVVTYFITQRTCIFLLCENAVIEVTKQYFFQTVN